MPCRFLLLELVGSISVPLASDPEGWKEEGEGAGSHGTGGTYQLMEGVIWLTPPGGKE